ncbi:hypothetical protein LP52_24735 [Streptomonospora alba]|uniref:Uncharacterized protein n=1 Tax=Streptomonospora alba TaxID=183763 RepID=A0A0C2FZI7_9ACTN|nr:hypothetical protein LP52_24735 [Streptomonospora alba]
MPCGCRGGNGDSTDYARWSRPSRSRTDGRGGLQDASGPEEREVPGARLTAGRGRLRLARPRAAGESITQLQTRFALDRISGRAWRDRSRPCW